jgi:hypothetical protein
VFYFSLLSLFSFFNFDDDVVVLTIERIGVSSRRSTSVVSFWMCQQIYREVNESFLHLSSLSSLSLSLTHTSFSIKWNTMSFVFSHLFLFSHLYAYLLSLCVCVCLSVISQYISSFGKKEERRRSNLGQRRRRTFGLCYCCCQLARFHFQYSHSITFRC